VKRSSSLLEPKKKTFFLVKSQGAERGSSAIQAVNRGLSARSDSSADRGSDRNSVEIRGTSKRRAYRAGSFKVPIDDPAMLRGDQGDLGRRFKKHLRGVVSRTAISDPDETIPSSRPAQTRLRLPVPEGSIRSPRIFGPGRAVALSSDDGGDDEVD